jgi:GntR family transcriptional repressor for pyruvate dehydrogenase complex
MSRKFGAVAKSTLADEVAQRVAEMIREGTYEPGDRLPSISEMASRFEVGHPTLREALKKLEVLGTVEIKHGSGVYVKNDQDVLLMSNPIFAGEVSKDMMLDLIEARIPIELKAAEGAARNASAENIERLEELLEKADEHMEDDAYLTEVNMAFHREIAVASGNTVMAQVLEVLANLFENEQRMLLDIHGSREEDHAEHLEILNAIRKGDASLARDRMENHLEGVRRMAQQWGGED